MARFSKNSFFGFAALVIGVTGTSALADDNVGQITAVLEQYEGALNASDTSAVMNVYAEDAVFMPQHGKPQVGSAAIEAAYNAVFSAIDLDIDFTIDEIEVLSAEWAFARTRSEGTTVIFANGIEVAEGNQEVFLLNRQADGSWKVARYIFSTTNPLQ